MTWSRRRLATLGVLGGTFLAAIEATIVATAMPTVVAQLGGLTHYSWVFSAYIVASTVTVPLWGKMSDLYGRRRLYLGAVGLFVLGSALSGASQSMTQLIVFRAVQGIGAGGLLPLGLTILGDLYTLRERARMQGFFSGVWGLASIVGPLVGGYIAEKMSWRWVFYLNLPFGVAAAVLVGLALVEPVRHAPPRIDFRGAALLSAAVTVLLLALAQTGDRDRFLGSGTLLALYAAAGAFGWSFIRMERRAAEPIVPLDLLADQLVGAVTVCGFLVGVAMFGTISYVPLFVQSALGASATQAGTTLTPLLLGWVTMALVGGRILPHFGYRPMILVGLGFIAAGFIVLTFIRPGTPLWVLRTDLGFMGMGMGLTMLTLLLAMQNAVDRDRLGVATSFGLFTRSMGGAVGVALMGAIVTASLPAGDLRPGDLARGLHRAFVAGAIVSLIAWTAALKVPAGRPGPRPEEDHAGRTSRPGPARR